MLVRLFVKTPHPLSIKDIMKEFNRQRFFPYNSSLYRQLHRLSKLNIVENILFSDNVIRYFFSSNNVHYYHFRCKKCKLIKSYPYNELDSKVFCKNKDFSITNKSIVIEGFCLKCKKI